MPFDEPQSRNEAILQNMLGAENVLPEPQSRIEELLQEILEQGGGNADPNAVHYTADTGKTEAEKAQARSNIDALGVGDLGTVFTYKGSVATVADLPATGNTVGDVWFVESELANFVWLVDELNPSGFWDEFGQPIDLSAYQLKPTVNSPVGAAVTITPVENSIYNCGTLTSLTISNPPATGSYSIVFTSGATATSTTFPATILGLEGFAAEANTIYEINVLDNRAVVGKWEVTA